ncbi:hypothetical protein AVEN_224737-1 [Araneus ventricosus]|uniref:Uncharacterized protein n=1 Tax=Araneus ventricosus TaxID=182803 RepID=A0A4Y2HX54_ARAVE|nr:hypothetical protein AVEN_224737-1 [Araneus ventricosus]
MKIHLSIFNVATGMILLLFTIVALIILVLLSTKPSLTDAQLKETSFSKISFSFSSQSISDDARFLFNNLATFSRINDVFSIFHLLMHILEKHSSRMQFSVESFSRKRTFVHRRIRSHSWIRWHHRICHVSASVLAQFFNFIEVFAVFSNILGFHKYGSDIYTVEKAVFSTLNSIFSSSSCFAAEVSRADEYLRRQVKVIAFSLRMSTENREQGELLYRFVKSKKQFQCRQG